MVVSSIRAIMQMVHRRYNAHGHKVTAMMCDSGPTLLALVGMLGMMGIAITFSPPGTHAQRIERYIGFSDDRKLACLASLPFYFPPELNIYAGQWVADVTNSICNSRSRPSTADIIVTGQRRIEHYKYPGLKLGDVCMVTEFLDKRRREAIVLDISAKLIHVAELGVCLGYSRDVPGAFNFIEANGTIFPRRVF